MKCPKCGFNSFEYYDSCKKCSADLTGFKQTYSITPMVLPLEAKERLAAELRAAENAAGQSSGTAETHGDMFSFDLPGTPPVPPAYVNNDPFNFDDPAPEVKQESRAKPEEGAFSPFFESASHSEDSPFAALKAAESPVPAAKAAQFSSEPGEFDLNSFSWGDTPATPASVEKKEELDDLDSLFGTSKDNSSK